MHKHKQPKRGTHAQAGAVVCVVLAIFVFFITIYKLFGDTIPLPVLTNLSPSPQPTQQTQDEAWANDEAASPAAAQVSATAQALPEPTQQASKKRFGLSLQSLLSMELPASKGVDVEEYPEDPYWAMEDENTDADSQQAEEQEQSPQAEPFTVPEVSGEGPRVLMYCTHSNEAFTATAERPYTASSEWRTLDPSNSILAVAGQTASVLNDQYNIPVLFNQTDHEQGQFYTTSYSRSLETVLKERDANPTLQVYLDIHRDAMSGEKAKNDVVEIDGKRCAKIMIVVGTGEGKTGEGWKDRPNWQANKRFADAITAELRKIHPGLARDVRVKTGRYNQHVSDHSLAIEVGHNMNTLEESLNSANYLAQALANVLNAE